MTLYPSPNKEFELMASFVRNLVLFSLLVAVSACSVEKRSINQVVDDHVLGLRLRTKFVKDKTIPSHLIHLKVREGIVEIEGELEAQDQINRTIEVCETESGVKEVKAFLVLKEFGRLKGEPRPAQDPLREEDLKS